MNKFLLLVLCLFAFIFSTNAQTIRYVKPTSTGLGNGTNWANAASDLRTVINNAAPGDAIWVAAGMYHPSSFDRNASFTMKNNVRIYGGFNGTETNLNERNWTLNQSILSGDLTENDIITGTGINTVLQNNANNSLHVISNQSLDSTAVLDGMYVQGGYTDVAAFGAPNAQVGGGMLNDASSVTVRNCTFRYNHSLSDGGAICIVNPAANSLPTRIYHCQFYQNVSTDAATSHGGAVGIIDNGNFQIYDCLFQNNGAISGGAIAIRRCISSTRFSIRACVFDQNFTGGGSNGYGGAIHSFQAPIDVASSVFYGNIAVNQPNNGGAIYGENQTYFGNVTNCTFYGDYGYAYNSNTANFNKCQFNNCIFSNEFPSGLPPGGGVSISNNSTTDNPFFINTTNPRGADGIWGTADDGLRVRLCSPAVDAGNNSYLYPEDTTALGGGARIQLAAVDMGAYERSTKGTTAYITTDSLVCQNQFPFVWRGKTISVPGVDTVSSLDSNNCGQVFILRSMARPLQSRFDTTHAKICSGQAYTWYQLNQSPSSNLYYTQGIYSHLLFDRFGCDSLVYLDLKVARQSFDTITVQSCLPFFYTFSGTTLQVNSYSMYSLPIPRGLNIDGCDSFTVYKPVRPNPISLHRVYVNAAPHGNNVDGLSWASAFYAIEDAAGNACANEVWVAKGEYRITTFSSAGGISLRNNVPVYGGFAGNETSLSGRNWQVNLTTITGTNATGTNASHLIYNNNNQLDSTAVLDGFIITNGNAQYINSTTIYNDGNGAGIYNVNVSPTFRNCTIRYNQSVKKGGGLYVSGGSPRFINCVFESNSAGDKGGGIYLEKSRSKFRQCVIGYNEALNDGAGIYYQSDTSSFESCDIVYNTTQQLGFGAVGNASGSVLLNNCIIWGNTGGGTNGAVQPASWLTVNNSDIQDNANGYGSNNINLEPAFFNKYNIAGYDNVWGTADDGLRLGACTQISGRGVNSIFLNTDKDLAGNPRIVGTIEMGAYEYQPTQAVDSIVYVKSNVAGGNRNGTSWANAFSDLQDAMTIAQTCSQVREIWVAAGTYKTTTSLRRQMAINLKNNLRLYGGFVGTETSAAQRAWKVNPTIISGDLGNADSVKDNSWHIVENYGLDSTAIIDGFTLRDGYNYDVNFLNTIQYSSLVQGAFYKTVSGAGMLNYNSSPIIRNCAFINNQGLLGGGMYNHNTTDILRYTPNLNDCIFINNTADKGGAIYEFNIVENIDRCVFDGNSASTGGCIFDMRGTTKINSSVFTKSNGAYAVFYGRTNGLLVKNTTFFNNNVIPLGTFNNGLNFGLELAAGFEFDNSIFWGTRLSNSETINNSIIQGSIYQSNQTSLYGMGNSTNNPLFTDTLNLKGSDGIWATADDGLTLKTCSPAINAGNNSWVTTPKDILGNNRILYSTVDQGAYESFINLTPAPVSATNNALRLDGINDWVEINNCSATQPLVNGGDSISIEYWFKGSNIQSAVRFQNAGDYVVPGWANSGNASNPPVHILSNDGGTVNGIPVGPVNDNKWHHVAMTWKRNTVNGFRSYMDGVLVAQRNSSNSPLPVISNGNTLGSNGGTSEFTNGTIDQVKVWNSIRTQDQVISDMCDTVSVQPNLLLYYDFNNGTVNGNNSAFSLFNNKAGNTYSGLLHNFSLTDTTSNFVNGASVSCCTSTTVLYVNAAATGLNNGQSWADAYISLQPALQNKCSGVKEIWVAKGTYTPTYGTFREASFNIKKGVSLLGGFNGNETTADQRNSKINKTTLSGDLANNDVVTGTGQTLSFSNISENSYHVVTAKGIDVLTKLDGFYIASGNASGTQYGGGGILNDSTNMTISNCVILHNYTNQYGGGLFNYRGLRDIGFPANVFNCVFTENKADAANSGVGAGGGVGDLNSNGYYANCIFEGNYALKGGGVFFQDGGDSRIINTTIVNNYATQQGAGLYNTLPVYTLNIDNSIVWNNTGGTDAVFGHMRGGKSDLQGFPYSGVNTDVLAPVGDIYNVDPGFINIANPKGADGVWATSDDQLQLLCTSTLINKGMNSSLTNSPAITTDIIGYPRYQRSVVDLGPYESPFAFGTNAATQPFTTNNALNFDGGNDYVEITNCNPSTPLFPGGNAITIEYWFKGTYHQSAVRYQYDNNAFIVAGWNGKHILSNDGGTGGINSGNATDGLWHHVAMTWQRNTANGFKSYLDGQLIDQRNSSDVPLPVFNTALNLGSNNGLSEFMNGSLDEVRIWTVARTQSQLRASMCSNLADTIGLLQYYNFDHGAYNNSNPTITTLTNVRNPGAFTGVLHGFNLAGGTSNWVNGFNTCCQAGFIILTWTGTVSADWQNPANWSGNMVPASCTDLVIPGGTPFSPVITSSESICHKISVNNGANVRVVTGAKLTVTGQ